MRRRGVRKGFQCRAQNKLLSVGWCAVQEEAEDDDERLQMAGYGYETLRGHKTCNLLLLEPFTC